MRSKSSTAGAFALPLALAMTCWLAGCQSIPATHTAETEATMVADLCDHAWRPVTYSSWDTEQTQIEARAANAARAAYCGEAK